MSKKLVFVFSLLLAFALCAVAADISGKWTGQVPGRQGQARETSFTFKVAGETLTGSMAGGQGQEVALSEGKISGDTISFVIVRERNGNQMKQNYSGKIVGEEIQMKRERPNGDPVTFTLKRAN